MKTLFNRVFDGSDEMFAKAEEEVNKIVAEVGRDAPLTLPSTAYFCACIYAYIGKKVTTTGELQDALADVKAMMLREPRTNSIFQSGVGTAIAAEMIEACKYVKTQTPYEGTNYHGHFTDAEVRELGVPLVTGDIPGFVVMIGPAPSTEEAVETIKGYQSRGIFVFLIGGIIEQAVEAGLSMGFPVRVVPVGEEIWSVGHVISLVVRAAMIFGAIQPGDVEGFHKYTFDRINAFVNAYKPVNDITVACGAGAIKLGFPVITNDHDDMWAVPKSLIIYDDTKDWIDTSIEARGIKLKITKIDIPVSFSSAFEGEIIRKADMKVEFWSAKNTTCELVLMKNMDEVEDHKLVIDGPDIDSGDLEYALATCVYVAGKKMQADFESVIERKIHAWFNYMEGVMHTGQRNQFRIRISKDAYDKGLRLTHFAEVLYHMITDEFDAVVDKCEVHLITDPVKATAFLNDVAIPRYNMRDDRLASMTDESVDRFFTCILCQSFAPAHCCVVTPERLGLCGAVSWLDAKATYELNPNGPSQPIMKEGCLDERTGRYTTVNDAIKDATHGAVEEVTLYSIMEDPMTSCGCFECISGIEPMSNGFIVVNREYAGMTPAGMTFGELASCTGGGVQTPGYMGHGRHFISSKKFIHAEGGIERIVWMPKELKDDVGERLNKTAKELYGIDNFTDMIADETVCTDCDALLEFLQEKNHPVLSLEPLM